MFHRANEVLGSNWTLHDLRHTASYRMAKGLIYVQDILAHRRLTTTQLYTNPSEDEAIPAGLAHHALYRAKQFTPPAVALAPHHDPAPCPFSSEGSRDEGNDNDRLPASWRCQSRWRERSSPN